MHFHRLLSLFSFPSVIVLALLLPVFTAGTALAKMTAKEEFEMKKRVLKQFQRGEIPEVNSRMPYEERLYILKRKQALEREQQQKGLPQSGFTPHPPDAQTNQSKEKKKKPHHRPSYSEHYPYSHGYHSHGDDWRQERCWRLWGGSHYQYRRCLGGDPYYLYPRQEQQITIYTGPVRQREVPYINPDRPIDLRAELYPTWYGARLSSEAVITVHDEHRTPRSFHLVGVGRGRPWFDSGSCIDQLLASGTVQVNEVSSASHRQADAEAIIFHGDQILNFQALAEGCAEFDAAGCHELGLDFCDILQDGESSARRNRLGIWR